MVLAVGFCSCRRCARRAEVFTRAGKLVGIVTAKTDKEITIKADGEDESKTLLLAPQGGGPKADLQAALKTVFVPNLVTFSCQGEDQPVISSIP